MQYRDWGGGGGVCISGKDQGVGHALRHPTGTHCTPFVCSNLYQHGSLIEKLSTCLNSKTVVFCFLIVIIC